MTKNTAEKFNAKSSTGTAIPEFIFLYKPVEGDRVEIILENLTSKTPLENRTLIESANITIQGNQKVGFTGPNGSGKSSLFRNIQGLTSDGSGKITRRLPQRNSDSHSSRERVFYASQEIRRTPKLLSGLLAFPYDEDTFTPEQYEEVLKKTELEHLLIHLPWNALKVENLLRFATPVLDYELRSYAGSITPSSAESFARAFKRKISKTLKMPDCLKDIATQEDREALVDAITGYVKEKLSSNPQGEQRSLTFPGFAARGVARKVAGNFETALDSWIIQGHRLTLSGGEQQKMVFARAFLQKDKADLFLLDEPTSALKGETAHELVGKLFEEIEDKTVIAIIHDESLLRHFTHHLQLGSDKKLTIKETGDNTPAPQAAKSDNKPQP